MSTFMGKRVAVLGASRGVGRELVNAARTAGATVLAVARGTEDLARLSAEISGTNTLVADISADGAPDLVFAAMRPDVLIVCGGAQPHMAPIDEQSWDQFSRNWSSDVRASFLFCKAALQTPLPKGSTVVLVSSGAALNGSPLSGGYAGAKRMQMFLAEYCQEQSDRLGLAIRFIAIAPGSMMPETALGKVAVEAYSAYRGVSKNEFMTRFPGRQTPAAVAASILGLLDNAQARSGNVFRVSARGIEEVA